MTAADDRLPFATLAALFVGYACSYFHRADLAVLAPLLERDDARAALRDALPDIASLGLFAYAMGKFVGGALADRFGGRRVFVAALLGAGLAELAAMRADAPATLAACRVVGMVVLGCAWPALGQVVATATPWRRLATVMAFVSQSYLLGDAMVRAVLAQVVARGGTPAAVLGTSATWLLGAGLVVGIALAGSWRRDRGRRAARAAASAAGHRGDGAATATAVGVPADGPLRGLLVALAAMLFALALVREGLSLWTPLLFVQVCALPVHDAVRASALLPLASGVGALLAGPLADRGARALLAVTALPALLGAAALAVVALGEARSFAFVLGAVALASALLAMPMSLASGVLPLRLAATGGGRRLGFVDGAGSLGSVLAGTVLGRVHDAFGVGAMFVAMAIAASVAAAFAALFHRLTVRRGAAIPPGR